MERKKPSGKAEKKYRPFKPNIKPKPSQGSKVSKSKPRAPSTELRLTYGDGYPVDSAQWLKYMYVNHTAATRATYMKRDQLDMAQAHMLDPKFDGLSSKQRLVKEVEYIWRTFIAKSSSSHDEVMRALITKNYVTFRDKAIHDMKQQVTDESSYEEDYFDPEPIHRSERPAAAVPIIAPIPEDAFAPVNPHPVVLTKPSMKNDADKLRGAIMARLNKPTPKGGKPNARKTDAEASSLSQKLQNLAIDQKPDYIFSYVNKYPSLKAAKSPKPHDGSRVWFTHIWHTNRRDTILRYLNHEQIDELWDHMDAYERQQPSALTKYEFMNEEINYIWSNLMKSDSSLRRSEFNKRIVQGFKEYISAYNARELSDFEEYDYDLPTALKTYVIKGAFAKDQPKAKAESDFEDDAIYVDEDYPEPADLPVIKKPILKKPSAASCVFPEWDFEDEDIIECGGPESDDDWLPVEPEAPLVTRSPVLKKPAVSRIPDPDPYESIHDPDTLTEKERSMLCHSCQERYIRTIIYPCEHMILCVTCALAWDKKNPVNPTCPTCRVPYTRISKPFFG